MSEPTRLCDMSPRLSLALQATWEIDSLLEVMLERMPTDFPDLATRGMCIRAKQLSIAIMDLVDENGSAIGEHYQSVHASPMPELGGDHG